MMSAAVSHPLFAGPRDACAIPVPAAELLTVAREYVEAGRLAAAERLLAHVLATLPDHAEALHLRGFVAFRQGFTQQAATFMERALAAGAGTPRQLCNLAEAYRVLGRTDEGLRLVRRAAALAPTDAVCHFNEAMLHYDRQELDLCIGAARRAISLRHDMAEAHMRLGQALLLTGAYREGWEEYEWRYGIAGAQPLMPPAFKVAFDRPQWDGKFLGPGQRLLLIADQGFGDVLMFARYLPWAMARCGDIVVAGSEEVIALLARVFPGPSYHTKWDDIGEHACRCPLSGLPRLAGTVVQAMPEAAPYLTAEPVRRRWMLEWLRARTPGQGLRVGVAWAGRPTHSNDRSRSVRLEQLAPLFDLPGASFVSLQKGAASAQLAGGVGQAEIHDAGGLLHSFEDTIALIDCLDLVVAVDTSVVHAAGALGKPAWVMLPYAPDWRWLAGRPDTAWYPTLRLYRQPRPGDWQSVISLLAEDLGELAVRQPGSSSVRMAFLTSSG